MPDHFRKLFSARGGRMALAAAFAGSLLSGCTAGGFGELSEAVTHPEVPSVSLASVTPDFSSFTIKSTPVKEARVITPADYMDGSGNCSAPAPAEITGVALGMSECDVVHAIGAPSQVEIGSDARGQSLVATYSQGARPGLYRFSDGELKSIERVGVADATPEPKAKKKPQPRSRRASN